MDQEKIKSPISKTYHYAKEDLLNIGAQVIMHQHVALDNDTLKFIKSLSINRNPLK